MADGPELLAGSSTLSSTLTVMLFHNLLCRMTQQEAVHTGTFVCQGQQLTRTQEGLLVKLKFFRPYLLLRGLPCLLPTIHVCDPVLYPLA